MSEVLQVVTTVGARADAEALARSAVDARLAACAQISGPVTSVYRWEGAVRTDEEWYVVFKTARYAELQAHLLDRHPYDVPEVVATPVVDGNPAYLSWVRAEASP